MAYEDQAETRAPGMQGAMQAERQILREKERADRAYTDACNEAPMRSLSLEQILAELFKYHPPTPRTLPQFAAIRQAAKNFAEVVLANCPAGSDRAAAINSVRIAAMIANQAIACDGLSLY